HRRSLGGDEGATLDDRSARARRSHEAAGGVFVRGFIRSYAKAIGVGENEPLSLYDRALKARIEAKRAQSARPVVDPVIAGIATDDDREGTHRRGLGLAVFVIILLLIATITLSLLLRRPPPSGEGLSLLDAPADSGSAPAAS